MDGFPQIMDHLNRTISIADMWRVSTPQQLAQKVPSEKALYFK